MTKTIFMIRRTLFAILAVLAMSATTSAGSIYTWLVIDPATTAGFGVPAVNGMSVSSTRSGAGTWHLFAVDDANNSGGIRSYLVKLNNASVSNNRSPVTGWDSVDQDGPFAAGFNAPRTALNAGQDPSNQVQIGGLGQTAGNFVLKLPTADPTAFTGTTGGQWGIYSVADGKTSGLVAATGHARNAIFLGEGTYIAGTLPSIDTTTPIGNNGTGFNFWKTPFPTSGSETISSAGSTSGQTLVNSDPWGLPEPATLTLVGLAVVGFGGLVGRRRS